jgi:DNA repair exonuclease SbcCD ATPase subunit
MTPPEDTDYGGNMPSSPVDVAVRNLGGITDCEVKLPPGVTVLSGENATNRTSLLGAVVGALGGDLTTLKSDADEGSVELRLHGETYTRTYSRQGDTVSTSGSPLCDESDIVDLFVGLVEQNRARQAVQRGDDLRDVIMEPVDTEEISRRIRETEREQQRVESDFEDIERRRARLPELRDRRDSLETELREVGADLETVRETVEGYDASEAEAKEAESLLEEVDERRRERDLLETEIDTQRTSIEALRDERVEAESELEDLSVEKTELDELDREIDRLKRRRRELDDLVSDLSAIVDVNADLVQSGTDGLPGIETGGRDPTAVLDPTTAEVECWTCGSEVPRAAIVDRLDELRDVVDAQREKRRSVATALDEAEERRAEIRAATDTRDELESRFENIDRQIAQREQRLETLKEDRQRVQDDIERLETRLEESAEFEDDELVEHYQRLSDLEYERGQLEQQLTDVESVIDDIEEPDTEEQQLEAQRDELEEELESLRSRIDHLERSAVEQFNERMADLLDLLDYENLERVWIERKADTGGRGEPCLFDLHLVRESDAGAVYEDSVETLSESEREVIGLVVALAGYLVHDVKSRVPFVILDSLEAIDANRIDTLLAYFENYASYLVVALLTEDAAALDVEHNRIAADEIGA